MERAPFLEASDYEALLALSEDLLNCDRKDPEIFDVVRRGARRLTGADGTTIVLREGDAVHYVEEDAIGPLWKGRRFPARTCVSGWAIEHARPVIIEDVYADHRMPVEAYRTTFVKSLVVVPFGVPEPIGALGAYWGTRRPASEREVYVLQRLGQIAARVIDGARQQRGFSDTLQMREEMLAAAAHELRNAVSTVALSVATLRPSIEERGDSRIRQGFDRLEQLVNDATRLLTSLLDASRLASGNLRLECDHVDLVEIVHTVIDRLREEVIRSGSHVTVSGVSEIHGQWDRLRIEQIVTNLLSNAIKYGTGNPIGIQIEERDCSASLTVSDEGIGIADDEQRRLFEPFARGPVGRTPGVGLGLWIVRRLVQAHGGSICVDSRPRHGTRFTVRLPRHLIEIPRSTED